MYGPSEFFGLHVNRAFTHAVQVVRVNRASTHAVPVVRFIRIGQVIAPHSQTAYHYDQMVVNIVHGLAES